MVSYKVTTAKRLEETPGKIPVFHPSTLSLTNSSVKSDLVVQMASPYARSSGWEALSAGQVAPTLIVVQWSLCSEPRPAVCHGP